MRFPPFCSKMRTCKVEFLQNPHVLLMLVELLCTPALLFHHGILKTSGVYTHLTSPGYFLRKVELQKWKGSTYHQDKTQFQNEEVSRVVQCPGDKCKMAVAARDQSSSDPEPRALRSLQHSRGAGRGFHHCAWAPLTSLDIP